MLTKPFVIHFIVASALLVLIGTACQNSHGQTSGPALSEVELEQVLDLTFPRDILETVGTYSFVLRYEPSFGKETQITMVERGGKTVVVHYVLENGNIERQVNSIRKRFPQASPQVMAKSIKVTKREIVLNREEGANWLNEFYENSCLTFMDDKLYYKGEPITVVMDGTRYQLWYHGHRRVHYDLSGTDCDSAKEPNEEPLITWMKKIYHQVKSM